jgi:hypothetical protein
LQTHRRQADWDRRKELFTRKVEKENEESGHEMEGGQLKTEGRSGRTIEKGRLQLQFLFNANTIIHSQNTVQ